MVNKGFKAACSLISGKEESLPQLSMDNSCLLPSAVHIPLQKTQSSSAEVPALRMSALQPHISSRSSTLVGVSPVTRMRKDFPRAASYNTVLSMGQGGN